MHLYPLAHDLANRIPGLGFDMQRVSPITMAMNQARNRCIRVEGKGIPEPPAGIEPATCWLRNHTCQVPCV